MMIKLRRGASLVPGTGRLRFRGTHAGGIGLAGDGFGAEVSAGGTLGTIHARDDEAEGRLFRMAQMAGLESSPEATLLDEGLCGP